MALNKRLNNTLNEMQRANDATRARARSTGYAYYFISTEGAREREERAEESGEGDREGRGKSKREKEKGRRKRENIDSELLFRFVRRTRAHPCSSFVIVVGIVCLPPSSPSPSLSHARCFFPPFSLFHIGRSPIMQRALFPVRVEINTASSGTLAS